MRHFISDVVNRILFLLLYIRMRLLRKNPGAENILIIRFSHIGDFVVWLDSAKEYRNLYPGEKIIFLCDRYKDVSLLAEKMGYFDEVMVLETRGFGRLKSIRRVMGQRYRVVVNADTSRTTLSDNFVMAARANERIAPRTDLTRIGKKRVRCSDRIYDRVIPCDGIKTMELVRNAQFIRGLSGNQDFRAQLPRIPVLPCHAALGVKNYFALCPGAETERRYWNAEKFAQVVNFIFDRNQDITCVALGTAREAGEWNRILQNVIQKERTVSMFGKTDILEYVEAVRGARFLVTNDTSAAHIAGAVGTPAAVAAAGSDRGRFYPYQVEQHLENEKIPIGIHADVDCAGCAEFGFDARHLKCLENGRMRCVNRITAEQMICVVQKFMEQDGSYEMDKS